jgi:hypothetical protein
VQDTRESEILAVKRRRGWDVGLWALLLLLLGLLGLLLLLLLLLGLLWLLLLEDLLLCLGLESLESAQHGYSNRGRVVGRY